MMDIINNRQHLFLFSFLCSCSGLFAQQNTFEKGARYYHRSDFEMAANVFEKGATTYNDPRFRYNLGNALFRQGLSSDALQQYQLVFRESNDSALKASALYNSGVVLQHTGALQEAVAAYRQALLFAPKDSSIRKNLQLLMTALARNRSSTRPPQPQKQPDLQSLRTEETKLQKKLLKKQAKPALPEKDW